MKSIVIEGKINKAICYAAIVDEIAGAQIRRMCDYVITEGSCIRIMPDVHAGKGCTIGTTMTIKDKAVPNIVGVDIGCGMYTVELGRQEIDLEKIDAAAHYIPSGRNVWEEVQEAFDLRRLRCCADLKKLSWLERSLGTLGGGNHFIEIDRSAAGENYLIIHSGSRNLGKQVAEIYQQLAVNCRKGIGNYKTAMAQIIETYRAEGRAQEIEKALKQLKKDLYCQQASMPEDLCYLDGKELEDYLYDINICQEFARKNRERMAQILLERAGLKALNSFHTIHNYIDTQEMILRKGAIAAHAGEKVLIPMNMRDGCILAVGLGNPEWNYSAPHGAGRIMSRLQAKQTLSLQAYAQAMEGIYTTSVNEETLDEAPMAYKPLEAILPFIKETVQIIDIIKPVYNFKAAE